MEYGSFHDTFLTAERRPYRYWKTGTGRVGSNFQGWEGRPSRDRKSGTWRAALPVSEFSFFVIFYIFFPVFSIFFIFFHFHSFFFIYFHFFFIFIHFFIHFSPLFSLFFIFLFIFLLYFHYFSFFSNFFHFLNFSSVLVCVGNLWFCTCVCWHSLLLYLRVRKKCWHSLLLYFCVLALFASVLACEKKMLALFTSVLVCVGTLCFFTCVWEKKNIFHRISWPSIGPATRMRAAGLIEDLEFQ